MQKRDESECAVIQDWRCAPVRAKGSPRRCAIAADARTLSGDTKRRVGITGAEADGSLLKRYHLFYRPGEKLALAESGYCVHPGAIAWERHLVFGNGLLESVLRAQHLGFGEMRKPAAGRCC